MPQVEIVICLAPISIPFESFIIFTNFIYRNTITSSIMFMDRLEFKEDKSKEFPEGIIDKHFEGWDVMG